MIKKQIYLLRVQQKESTFVRDATAQLVKIYKKKS